MQQDRITAEGRITAEVCRRAFDMIDKAMYNGFTKYETELISGLYLRMTKTTGTGGVDRPAKGNGENSC